MVDLNLKMPDSFFDEEIRCDYKVTTKQKKIWAVALDLLNELLRVCKKYNIKVYAFAGTILGAVRHKGFIPWDDDIDVCMEHEEYLKLVKVAEKEFKDPYFFQNPLTDSGYFFKYARLRNSNTTGYIKHIKNPESKNYNQGIFIDIFVLNGYTDNKAQLKRQLFEMDLAAKACRAYVADTSAKKGLKRILTQLVQKAEHRFISYEDLIRLFWKAQCKYDGVSDRITPITSSIAFMNKYHFEKKGFDNPQYLEFENLMIPVPSNYISFLTHAYGDYMQFPPIEQRGKWHEDVIIFDPDTPYKDYIIGSGDKA